MLCVQVWCAVIAAIFICNVSPISRQEIHRVVRIVSVDSDELSEYASKAENRFIMIMMWRVPVNNYYCTLLAHCVVRWIPVIYDDSGIIKVAVTEGRQWREAERAQR